MIILRLHETNRKASMWFNIFAAKRTSLFNLYHVAPRPSYQLTFHNWRSNRNCHSATVHDLTLFGKSADCDLVTEGKDTTHVQIWNEWYITYVKWESNLKITILSNTEIVTKYWTREISYIWQRSVKKVVAIYQLDISIQLSTGLIV